MSSSTTSTSPFSIAVVGGGIAGVTLTIALLNRGLNVRLYERGANFEEVGAGIGVSINAVRAMALCDLSERRLFLPGLSHRYLLDVWPSGLALAF